MERGTIVRYFDAKKFGFIKPLEGRADVFFHLSVVVGDYLPSTGDPVEYDYEFDQLSRPKATKVVSALRRSAA
jgi:cold shock CspA family protein